MWFLWNSYKSFEVAVWSLLGGRALLFLNFNNGHDQRLAEFIQWMHSALYRVHHTFLPFKISHASLEIAHPANGVCLTLCWRKD